MTQIKQKPFILVDGSFYLYRAYYSIPILTNNTGEQTNAIYGVLNMLRNLIIEYKSTHIAIIFDAKGKTFRNELFKKYKSQRQSMPDNLQKQIEPLCEIVSAIGFPVLTVFGVEADDVIGTLALQASKNGVSVLIFSGDKDMAQLVTHNVAIINTVKNPMLGLRDIVNRYGVTPELIVDLLALKGDSSDNIPGIPGIGEKTALALLKGIGSLKTIYQNLPMITLLNLRGSKILANKMIQHKDIAFLSYELATIKTNLNLTTNYNQLMMQTPNFKKLQKLFNYYGFKSWLVDYII